jgi:hypothetical protein
MRPDFLATIASCAKPCLKRVLAALHEPRRKQAALEPTKYRHLCDATTGIHIGTTRQRQAASPACQDSLQIPKWTAKARWLGENEEPALTPIQSEEAQRRNKAHHWFR